MKEFKDDEGRPWRLALTVSAAMRVRDLVSIEIEDEDTADDGTVTKNRRTVPVDVGNLQTIGPVMAALHSQVITLAETLYAILIPQIEERKLSRDAFLDGLRGDSLEAAADALESEIIDFFRPGHRPLIASLARKVRDLSGQVMTVALATVEAIEMPVQSGGSFGKPQASSAFTQESGRTDSSQLLETHA